MASISEGQSLEQGKEGEGEESNGGGGEVSSGRQTTSLEDSYSGGWAVKYSQLFTIFSPFEQFPLSVRSAGLWTKYGRRKSSRKGLRYDGYAAIVSEVV